MKIKKDHLNHIKVECLKVFDKYPNLIAQYESGKFPRSEHVQNLQTRFNFDVYYVAGLTRYSCDVLYDYLDDGHIASALRSFMPSVTKRY